MYLHYITSDISTSIRNKITCLKFNQYQCKYIVSHFDTFFKYSKLSYPRTYPPRIVSRVQTCFTWAAHVEKTGNPRWHWTKPPRGERKREREGKTRGPHSWLLYRHEVRPRWPRLGEGQRGGRSEESVGLPHSRDGRPSLEGVGGTRVAILRSSGCKTCQNLTGSPPPRLSIPPHWVTTRILSISIRNSLESLPWKIKAFSFFLLLLCLEIQRWSNLLIKRI